VFFFIPTSEEKSKVVKLKKNSSKFLVFRLKAHRKRTNKRILYVARLHMTKKAFKNAQVKVKQAIKAIQKQQSAENVWRFNTVIMGIQNYYSAASHITDDLNELNYHLHKALYNRLKEMRREALFQDFTKFLQKRYESAL
jgi:RNA-directed DNA polymerase